MGVAQTRLDESRRPFDGVKKECRSEKMSATETEPEGIRIQYLIKRAEELFLSNIILYVHTLLPQLLRNRA